MNTGTVFIVDDELTTLHALEEALRTEGRVVEGFLDAAALLARLTPEDHGCVLLDLRLPGLNGLELQAALAGRGLSLPIIFVSGHAEIPAVVSAMQRGALDFLPKPIDLDRLEAAVDRALRLDAQRVAEQAELERLRGRWAALTQRERDVCRLSARGLLTKQIAAELGTAQSTVQVQRASAWRKLQIDSPAELVRLLAQLEPAAEPAQGPVTRK